MRWLAPSLAALYGCYSPAGLTECTVSCNTPGASCGNGLTCGDDHLCFATSPCTQPIDAPLPDASCQPTPADLDGDCVLDSVDPCIAPPADATGDFDQDGMLNGMDPCPWDNATTGDADMDSIPAPCDPSPITTGDHVRCVMAFSD